MSKKAKVTIDDVINNFRENNVNNKELRDNLMENLMENDIFLKPKTIQLKERTIDKTEMIDIYEENIKKTSKKDILKKIKEKNKPFRPKI